MNPVKPNWSFFEQKFNGRTHETFEWLSYLMFCYELGLKFGISGYFNQPAIEKEPVRNKDGKLCVFQAKYWKNLSYNKKEILDSIEGAAKRNVEIFYFYCNSDWGLNQQKGCAPVAKTEAENLAKEKNMLLVWMTGSNFDAICANEDFRSIAEYFFVDTSITQKLVERTKEQFNAMKTNLSDIDRTNVLDSILKFTGNVIILAGNRGVGKSFAIKKLNEQICEKLPLVMLDCDELSGKDSFIYGFTYTDTAKIFQGYENRYLVLDAAEKFFESDNTKKLCEIMTAFLETENKDESWRIILTLRDSYLEKIKDILNSQGINGSDLCFIKIDELKDVVVKKNITDYDSFNSSVQKMLRSPFFLNIYKANMSNFSNGFSVEQFKEKCFSTIIPKQFYSDKFVEVVYNYATQGINYLKSADFSSQDCCVALEQKNVIRDTGKYFVCTHDIYRELALEKKIQEIYDNGHDDVVSFFSSLGSYYTIRQAYRVWLTDKLDSAGYNEVNNFIKCILCEQKLDVIWVDETLVAILQSQESNRLFTDFKQIVENDNCKLLLKISELLRIACVKTSETALSEVGIDFCYKRLGRNSFTRPEGKCWKNFIEYTLKLDEKLVDETVYGAMISVFDDWTSNEDSGDTTKLVAQYAFNQYIRNNIDSPKMHNGNAQKIIKIISNGSSELNTELKDHFKNLKQKIVNNEYKNDVLLKSFMNEPYCSQAVVNYTQDILYFMATLWKERENEDDYEFFGIKTSTPYDTDSFFGIDSSFFTNHYGSALSTTLCAALDSDIDSTLDFIIDFTNYSVNKAVENKYYEKYILGNLPGQKLTQVEFDVAGQKVKQWANQSLWNTYRGYSQPVTPNLLQSIHMALEFFLLQKGQCWSTEELQNRLKYILQKSQSISLSAVVCSIVTAYPQKTFETACILLSVPECALYDFARKDTESRLGSVYRMCRNDLLATERLSTLSQNFRRHTFESTMMSFQLYAYENDKGALERRKETIASIIDKLNKQSPSKERQYWINRVDIRLCNISETETLPDGTVTYSIERKPEIIKNDVYDEKIEQAENLLTHFELQHWANSKWEKRSQKKDYSVHEILKKAKEILDELRKKNKEMNGFAISIKNLISNPAAMFVSLYQTLPVLCCACLVRDNFEELDKEEKLFCFKIIFSYAGAPFSKNYSFQYGDGTEYALAVLGRFLCESCLSNNDKKEIKKLLVFALLEESNEEHKNAALKSIKLIFDTNNTEFNQMFDWIILLQERKEKLDSYIREEGERFRKNRDYKKYFKAVEKLRKEFIVCLENCLKGRKADISKINFAKLSGDTYTLLTSLLAINIPIENYIEKILLPGIKYFNSVTNRNTQVFEFAQSVAKILYSCKQEYFESVEKNLVSEFTPSTFYSELLNQIIINSYLSKDYEKLWLVWNELYSKIITVYNQNKNLTTDFLVRNYLFSGINWPKDVQENGWEGFTEDSVIFFEKAAKDFLPSDVALFSYTSLFSTVGKQFFSKSLDWIFNIVVANKNAAEILRNETKEKLELYVCLYTLSHKSELKEQDKKRNKLIEICDYLCENGSKYAYQLRDELNSLGL